MLRRRVSRLPLRSPGNSGNPMAMPIHRHHFPGSLLLALLLLGGTAGAADGTHVPAPLNLEADLRDGRLQLSLLIDRYLFRHWTGIDVRTLPELGDEEYEERCEEVARFLAIHAPVAIDAIDVRPVIEDLAYLEGTQDTDFLEFAEVVAHYGAPGEPGTIEFVWSRYDTEDDYPLEAAFLVFSSPEDYRVLQLRGDSPAAEWRRPGSRPTLDPEAVPPGVPAPQGALPVLSALLVLLGLVGGARRRRAGRRGAPALVLAALLGAGLTSSVLVVPFRWPGEARVELPPPEDARALFETLHRNIYRAFDYDDEGAVYDALSRSLAPELIDDVYAEIYRSLRMKLEYSEDATCTIRSVRTLDASPEMAGAPIEPAFDVVARWEVIGTVRHWGHGHWRTNRYQARYRVRWSEADGWRIGAVEVLEQERLDDGREVAL